MYLAHIDTHTQIEEISSRLSALSVMNKCGIGWPASIQAIQVIRHVRV
jgi:hypothetical protein